MADRDEDKIDKAGGPEDARIGVYVCHCGGNISDKVDVEKVADAASALPGVVVARTYSFMCSDPGQALIIEDIEKSRLDRVVVASCSPSLHELTFRNAVTRGGLNPFLYEHVNVREQVSWVHASPSDATEKATTLVAAGVARVRRHEPLEPIRVDACPRALVVGGGVAGLRAALDLAHRGLPVTLVETRDRLGGFVADLPTLFPTGESGPDLVREMVRDVEAHEGIAVLTSTHVRSARGYVGNFTVEVGPSDGADEETPQETREIEAGAVVVATGFAPYEPARREFGFGKMPQIVTLPGFMERLAAANGSLTLNGDPIRRVAFIHCVGSRQIEGIHKPKPGGTLNTNCSRVCCAATLKAINDLKERFPEVAVYDFYRDIRTYGRGQEEIYEQASKNGTVFLRYEPEAPPEVRKAATGDPGKVLVSVRDGLTWGEEVEVPVDVVVLAVGMEPADVGALAESLKLARGPDRFLQEVHPKLRPVEVAVGGVVLAGTCQSPRDVTETCASASAAAVKAATILARGHVELDPFVARVDPNRCDGTGACIEECAYEGAIRLEETQQDGNTVRRAVVNGALCVGCGVCVAVCPNRALDINGWTVDQIESMIDAICAEEAVS